MKTWLSIMLIATIAPACAGVKPILRDINDLARKLCETSMSSSPDAAAIAEKEGISREQAAVLLCQLRDVFDPFLDEILRAKAAAVSKASALRHR